MFLAVAGALTFTASIASAQDQPAAEGEATEQVQEAAPAEEAPAQLTAEDLLKGTGEDVPFHQQLKSYFIQGGPGFMSMILLCLIIGLALAIERILYLSFAKTNTKKLVKKVEDALAEGGVEKAKEVCRNTKGPVASIFYDGLLHYDEGLDVVEENRFFRWCPDEPYGEQPLLDLPLHRNRSFTRILGNRHRYGQGIRCYRGCR